MHRCKPDQEAFNESFFSFDNALWFDRVVLNYLPPCDKHLVFLPCGMANKTRNKRRVNGVKDPKGEIDPRKYISEGMTHEFMKSIRTHSNIERVILSEPLTLIPIVEEANPLRKDYNLPPDYLTIQGERCFINQVSMWLMRLKLAQPGRTHVYYCGGAHHFLILHFANIRAGSPFTVYHSLADGGTRGYTNASDKLVKMIDDIEERSLLPVVEPVEAIIERFMKSRGRYTHKRFWRSIMILQRQGKSIHQPTFTSSEEMICTEAEYIKTDHSSWYSTS